MRKYQQLILLIISIISVSLLLIYRHEYNRLRYVLEVFNFFGQPNDCSFPDLLNITNTLQHDWGPTPIWTTENKYAIYSAFIKNEHDVEVLVVQEDDNYNAIQACYVWFESSVNADVGKISYSKVKKLNNNNNLAFFKYNCHIDIVTEEPYAVSFADNNNKVSKELKKIIIAPKPKKKSELTTVCVIPSPEYSKQQIVEFISFYKIIGVDSFIIYNNNIPYKFMHLLHKLSLKLGLEIQDYTWNYPNLSTDDIKPIIEEDCLLRTKDRSINVIILNFNEFLVPKHHFTLSAFIDSFDPTNRINRFGLKVLLFCIDSNINKRDREPSMVHNVYYDDTNSQEYLYMHRNNAVQANSVINSQEISDSIAAIHRYVSCTSQPKKMDSTMLRFSKDIRKSTLFKLFKYNRL